MSVEVKPLVRAERTSYENIEATCPHCGRYCILNRASDLRDFMPVARKDVACTECGKIFALGGDIVSPGYRSIIYDSTDLLKRKRFMLAVAGACQAYEMFFALYLRVELMYKPFWRDYEKGGGSISALNEISKSFLARVDGFSFDRMRSCFLQQAVSDVKPESLKDAAIMIDSLGGSKSPRLSEIRRAAVEGHVKKLLCRVAKTEVNALRNKVVHQRAYRPRRGEAEGAVKEARSLLFRLGHHLDLRENINWYRER